MADIFVSYAKEDRDLIRSLSQALENEGWSTWWDREIPPGKTWDDVIEQQLTSSKCVLVAWSKNSVSSRYVREEADEAISMERPLVPVGLDGTRPPFGFRRIHAASLADWQGDTKADGYRQLVEAITSEIGRDAKVDIQGDTSTPPRGERRADVVSEHAKHKEKLRIKTSAQELNTQQAPLAPPTWKSRVANEMSRLIAAVTGWFKVRFFVKALLILIALFAIIAISLTVNSPWW